MDYKITYELKKERHYFVGVIFLLSTTLLSYGFFKIISYSFKSTNWNLFGIFLGLLSLVFIGIWMLSEGINILNNNFKLEQEKSLIKTKNFYLSGEIKKIEKVIFPKETKTKLKYKTIYENAKTNKNGTGNKKI